MTTLPELRNRFASQLEQEQEQEQPQSQQEVGTGITETAEEEKTEEQDQDQDQEEEQEQEAEEAADTPQESEAPIALPKDKHGREYVEMNGKRYYLPNRVREDEYGHRYVFVEDEKFYAEEPSWNTPFPVALSISLIMGINIVNIFCALAQIYTC